MNLLLLKMRKILKVENLYYIIFVLSSFHTFLLVEEDTETMMELNDELPPFDETARRLQEDFESRESSMHY